MAFKILLNVCCEKTELNTSRQNLRYEMDTGVIRSDTEEFARCFNCGQKISGELYIDCGISSHTGLVKTGNELLHEAVKYMNPVQLDSTGMMEG